MASTYMRRVRLVLVSSLIAAAACLVVMGIAYPQFGALVLAAAVVVGYAQYKKGGPLDSHGTARWASLHELERLTDGAGTVIGQVSSRVSRWMALRYLFMMPWLSDEKRVRRFLDAFKKAPEPEVLRLTDAVHTAVFAPSGAGKNVSVVFPTLLSDPTPAVITDLKGENFRVTAKYRAERFGHQIIALDPWGEVTKAPATLNPLDFIDPNDPESIDKARAVAESLVLRDPNDQNKHFADMAAVFITGAILGVKSFRPPEHQNLQEVATILANKDALAWAIQQMKASNKHGGLLQRMAGVMETPADRERASILSSCNRFLEFLNTPAVAASTRSTTGFKPADLDGKSTTYLVLPAKYMKSHSALMRMWLNTMLQVAVERGTGAGKVNFVMDECANLGPMESIQTMSTIGRGYGINMLLIFQSMGQIKVAFPADQGATLLSNVSQVFFGVNDKDTAEYVSSRLGEETIAVSSGGYSEGTNYSVSKDNTTTGGSTNANWNWSQMGRKLLTPAEVTNLNKRACIVLHSGYRPIMSWLTPHYEGNPFPKPLGMVRAVAEAGAMAATSLGFAFLTAMALLGRKS